MDKGRAGPACGHGRARLGAARDTVRTIGRYKLYDYAPSGNCFKVRLLLAHLGLPYERVPVDIFAGETMTQEYGEMNPALATPVLELAPGSYLAESDAILLYLAEGTHLLPADREERAQVYRWLFFEQGTILPTVADLRFQLLTRRTDPDSQATQRATQVASAVLVVLERHLQGREFAVGERFSVADIALFGYVHVAGEAGVEMANYPAIGEWLERVRAQPGHIEDLAPYPDNAQPGKGSSIHDLRTG